MNRVMLIYPPGKPYQRGEDRAQSNIDQSATASVHACNDLGYCASILREEYDVFLHDYQTENNSFSDLINDVYEFDPDLIFISTTNATIFEDLSILKEIRKNNSCLFVLKGSLFYNPNLNSLKSLDLSIVSCCIGGEVEFIIKPVIDALLKKSGLLEDIPGILYQKKGQWLKSKFDCWNIDLDSLPFPARDLMNNSIYIRPDTGEPLATISVSRGCPSNCIYCLTPIISGRNVRKRAVENVFREIEECYYKFGIKNFFFKADTFTIDEEYAIAICDRILNSELKGKIEFTVNSRVKPLSMNLLEKLKESGCFAIAVGFESGSEETLKRIKKGTTVDDNVNASRLIRSSGIQLLGFFMIGFPWENKENIKKTIEHIFKIKPDFMELHIAMPYYGTELFESCKKHGTLSNISFGFDYYCPNTIGTKTVDLKQLEKIKNKTLLSFYLRPGYIVKRLFLSLNKPKVFLNYIKKGLHLLKNCLLGERYVSRKNNLDNRGK